MMRISGTNATELTMVGKPVAIPGEFPNTVAASMRHKLACVGSTGAVAGISCAPFSMEGLGEMDCLRPYQLNQTTPPVGPTNTVSHSFFSTDGNALVTTVKGDPMKNNTGFMSVFSVQGSDRGMARLSRKEMRSSPNGTAVLFGAAPLPNTEERPFEQRMFVTDASFGAAVLSMDNKGMTSVVASQKIQGQNATCWAALSTFTKTVFVTDVNVNRLVEMSAEDASIVGELDLSANGDRGMIDLRAAGQYVYVLAPGNSTVKPAITVLDVSGGKGSMKQKQHFDLSGLAGPNAMGMAVML